MIKLKKEDLPILDGLLEILIKKKDILAKELNVFDQYNGWNNEKINLEFKRLAYFFWEYGCGTPKKMENPTSWISITSSTVAFHANGGFTEQYRNKENEKSSTIINDFSGSTIGQVNQSKSLIVKQTEIKSTTTPKKKEKQQNVIISFIGKFWWRILIPLLIGIILTMIEKGVINIGV